MFVLILTNHAFLWLSCMSIMPIRTCGNETSFQIVRVCKEQEVYIIGWAGFTFPIFSPRLVPWFSHRLILVHLRFWFNQFYFNQGESFQQLCIYWILSKNTDDTFYHHSKPMTYFPIFTILLLTWSGLGFCSCGVSESTGSNVSQPGLRLENNKALTPYIKT